MPPRAGLASRDATLLIMGDKVGEYERKYVGQFDGIREDARENYEDHMDRVARILSELEGTDAPRDWEPMEFPSDDASEDTAAGSSDVAAQVDRLIGEAQNPTNLCRLYWGWSPFL